jgi:hypothetical protein
MSIEDEFWQRQLLPRFKSVQQIGVTHEVVDTVLYLVSVIAAITCATVITLG